MYLFYRVIWPAPVIGGGAILEENEQVVFMCLTCLGGPGTPPPPADQKTHQINLLNTDRESGRPQKGQCCVNLAHADPFVAVMECIRDGHFQ